MLASLERQVMLEKRGHKASKVPKVKLVKLVLKEVPVEQDPKGSLVFLAGMAKMVHQDWTARRVIPGAME